MSSQEEPHSPFTKRPRTKTNNTGSMRSVPTPTTTKHTPWWLGDMGLCQGNNRARDQVTALAVAATSKRCGARSPARIMGGHLTQQFWRDWVIGCTRVFVIEVRVGETLGAERWVTCDVVVGVSVPLLGVTQLWVVDQSKPEGWFGEKSGSYCDDEQLIIFPKDLTHIPSTYNEQKSWDGGIWSCCARGKDWKLSWGKTEWDDLACDSPLTVQEVSSQKLVDVALPQDYSSSVKSIHLSEVIPSQAVLLLNSDDRTHTLLLVVDVPRTYTAGSLIVLSTNKCSFPQSRDRQSRDRAVTMKSTSGQNVFIAEQNDAGMHSPVVFSVRSNGVVQKLYDDLAVSLDLWKRVLWEVTESLVSVYNPRCHTVDVWDFNGVEASSPKSKIEHVGIPHIAGGGFIFIVTDTHALHVVEPSSLLVVASIAFLHPSFLAVTALRFGSN